MNRYQIKNNDGFTLIELMIAVVLSMLLVLGISGVFVSLKQTATDSEILENTQEVLRFTGSVLRRAVSNANAITVGTYTDSLGTIQDTLTLTYNMNSITSYTGCQGTTYTSAFFETYVLDGSELYCVEHATSTVPTLINTIGTALITNINALTLTFNSSNLVTADVTPVDQTAAITMMFASRQTVLSIP